MGLVFALMALGRIGLSTESLSRATSSGYAIVHEPQKEIRE